MMQQDVTVLFQENQVLTSSDLNALSLGLLELTHQLTIDLVGWHGTSTASAPTGGWPPALSNGKVSVGPGEYFINGIRCRRELRHDPLIITERSTLVFAEAWYEVASDHLSHCDDPACDTPAARRVQAAHQIRAVEADLDWTDRDAVKDQSRFEQLLSAFGVERHKPVDIDSPIVDLMDFSAHFAPLAFVEDGVLHDLRRVFDPLGAAVQTIEAADG